MSAWRLDELYTADEGGLIADLEVAPGDPATHRRIERLERVVSERPGVWQNRVALALPMSLWDADNSLLITIAIAAAGLAIAGQARGTPATLLERAGSSDVGVQGGGEGKVLIPA